MGRPEDERRGDPAAAVPADVEAMRAFLETLGLQARIESERGGWAVLLAGRGAVSLHDAATSGTGGQPGQTGLTFEAEDIDELKDTARSEPGTTMRRSGTRRSGACSRRPVPTGRTVDRRTHQGPVWLQGQRDPAGRALVGHAVPGRSGPGGVGAAPRGARHRSADPTRRCGQPAAEAESADHPPRTSTMYAAARRERVYSRHGRTDGSGDRGPGRAADGGARVIAVRRAELGDVEAVREIGVKTWPVAYGGLASEEFIVDGLAQWWSPEAVEWVSGTGSPWSRPRERT